MSWSINFIGTPESISKALIDKSETLSGPSKEEYDAALPHIDGLVKMNFNTSYPTMLEIKASGHAHHGFSSCNVSIVPLVGQLV